MREMTEQLMSDLERVLDSGSLDDIDAILTALESGASDEQALAAIAESGDTGSTPPADPPGQSAAQPTPVEPVTEDVQPVIRAKDGVHEIPFSVLESERRAAAAMRQQLDDLNRRNALLEQQLTAADIKPKQLPENVRFSPEQLAELESYGDIGAAVATLAQQNAVLMEQLKGNPEVQPAAEPQNPFAQNADTLRWAADDTQWGVVETINAALNADPNWVGKSLDQRVPEIVRRTKLALGETTDASIDRAADAALQRAARVAPNSLTDIGGEVPGSTKTPAEMLENASMQDVQAYLEAQMAKGLTADQALAAVL
jgi:hypothetical protein